MRFAMNMGRREGDRGRGKERGRGEGVILTDGHAQPPHQHPLQVAVVERTIKNMEYGDTCGWNNRKEEGKTIDGHGGHYGAGFGSVRVDVSHTSGGQDGWDDRI